MSFSLAGFEQFNFEGIGRQFSDFLNGDDKLPDCRINFYEDTNGIFSDRPRIGRINAFSFFECADGLLVSDGLTYVHAYNDYSDIDIVLPDASKREFIREISIVNLILHAFRFTVLHSSGLLLHSATVVYNGCGVAFCGVPGAGKSTQAHLWEQHLGAESLNLDQPVVLFEDDGVLISGSPFSGKENCYRTMCVPLRAIVFVIQADENKAERITAAEAFSLLYLNNYTYPINKEIEQGYTAVISRLCQAVPVYKLRCTISADAVDAVKNAVFD